MNLRDYWSLPVEKRAEYFLENLMSTNKTIDYWVDWDKIKRNLKEHEANLNSLNYLIGKNKDIRLCAQKVFLKFPDSIYTALILVGIRLKKSKEIDILDFPQMNTYQLDFRKNVLRQKAAANDIDRYIDFFENIGLFKFLSTHPNLNLVDYVFGVELGMDTNARKNRSGTQNEKIIYKFIDEMCKRYNELEWGQQLRAKDIIKKWKLENPLPGMKTDRKFDAVIFNTNNGKALICETNFFNSTGSKLSTVAGNYETIYEAISKGKNFDFVWISDGPAWSQTSHAIEDAMRVIPNILNLKMVQDGMLEELII